MIVKFICPICKEEKKTKGESSDKIRVLLECGHIVSRPKVAKVDYARIESIDGKKLFPFQVRGCEFIDESGGRALINFEQGLGKTPTSTAFLTMHPDAWPAVFLTRSSLKRQVAREIIRWSNGTIIPQTIDSSKEKLHKGFRVAILSVDLLHRLPDDYFDEWGPVVTCILDETQSIKNHEAARTNRVRKLFGDCKYFIGLSGTPIKNNAVEFFPIINLIKPERFPSFNRFVYKYVDYYSNGYTTKYGGIRYLTEWKEDTKDFIIRKTREEVAPELPKVFRKFLYYDLEQNLTKEYDDLNDEFSAYFYAHQNEENTLEFYQNILAFFSKMRHITGLSKIQNTVEFAEEFLEETDRKLTLFVHHQDVGQIIYAKMVKYCQDNGYAAPVQLTSAMNPAERDNAVLTFTKGDCRVLVASTLASSEGLNLQECSDCVFVERQWNAVNEEQAESRFVRFGSTAEQVNANYMVAVDTIDEYFTELVESKRKIVKETLDGQEAGVTAGLEQQKIITELASVIASKGKKSWTKKNLKSRR